MDSPRAYPSFQCLYRGQIKGSIRVPSSKSDLLRLALLASFQSRIPTELECTYPCNDVQALIEALSLLGIGCLYADGILTINGANWKHFPTEISCHESAFLARTWPFLFSSYEPVPSISGCGTLLKRSQEDLQEMLLRLGLKYEMPGAFLPLQLSPYCLPQFLDLSKYRGSSSQLISGVLLGLARVYTAFSVRLGLWADNGYVQLTLSTFRRLGYGVLFNDGVCSISQSSDVSGSTRIAVEGDWSAAAMLIAAAVVSGGELTLEGLDLDSKQPDVAVLKVLDAMGVYYQWEAGNLTVNASYPEGTGVWRGYRAFCWNISGTPDLAIPLAALACCCVGESHIEGAHLLRGKESDRAQCLIEILNAFGVPCLLKNDCLSITGCQPCGPRRLHAHSDHRLAMFIAGLALGASGGPVTIEGVDCVSKSYPNFWKDLQRITERDHCK